MITMREVPAQSSLGIRLSVIARHGLPGLSPVGSKSADGCRRQKNCLCLLSVFIYLLQGESGIFSMKPAGRPRFGEMFNR